MRPNQEKKWKERIRDGTKERKTCGLNMSRTNRTWDWCRRCATLAFLLATRDGLQLRLELLGIRPTVNTNKSVSHGLNHVVLGHAASVHELNRSVAKPRAKVFVTEDVPHLVERSRYGLHHPRRHLTTGRFQTGTADRRTTTRREV
mmetsp:Transcript_7558/g.46480  ORF Transcript_7558/g.46480 Transcript_7558/m.46480 type:complete len:146 (+) Transcript_7558:2901-3338(+)